MNTYYGKTRLFVALLTVICMRNSHCSTTVTNKGLIERAKFYYNQAKNWAYQKKDTILNAAKNNPKTTIGTVVGIGALTLAYRSRQRIKQWFNQAKKIE